MKTLCVIPARMASSRFPGKPLKLINGIPMIKRVYNNVVTNNKIDFTYVATCDKKILNYIKSFHGNVILTSSKHKRATDRTAEALLKIEKKHKIKFNTVLMLQGDEPMITSAMISKLLNVFHRNPKIKIANLMTKIKSFDEFIDLNEPKVVVNKFRNAIYFSRCAIPSPWLYKQKNIYKQVCAIPFRRDYLLKFNRMKPTLLEKTESIDMNRIIENGDNIHMVEVSDYVKSIDTNSDLIEVEKLLKKIEKK
tara:strand:- start:5997 stop:6749 length:753 start_codon:yes stop_codon:yes gene_type:complete